MPLASVFTPVHNKGPYAIEAIQSVLAQDCGDFEYWILENSTDGTTRDLLAPHVTDPRIRYEEIDFTDEERQRNYVGPVLLNRYYAKAAGKYIFYLSDDDLFEPECIRLVTEFLEADESRKVCYFGLRITTWTTAGFVGSGGIAAIGDRGAGTDLPAVDCHIDGGQIAHRADILAGLERPWFPEQAEHAIACHADGLFMQKLAYGHTFYALDRCLVTHRRTPLSTWDRAA